MHEHVVYGSRYRPGPHSVRIRGSPRDLNGVHVGVPSDQRDDGIVDPLRRILGERVQCNQQRQRPELEDDRGADPAVNDLAEVADNEEPNDTQHCRRDGEKVRLGRVEAEIAQRERKVGLRGIYGNWKAV